MKHNRHIIVIDDDREIWQAYKAVLAPDPESPDSTIRQIRELMGDRTSDLSIDEERFELAFAAQGQEGFGLVKEAMESDRPFAVAFIDVRMPPGWDGMETAVRIRRVDPNVEIVIVTAYSDRSRSEIARALGDPAKFLFVRKPFDVEELKQLAVSLTEKWNITRREEEQRNVLRHSEARFRALVETTSDWVWEADQQGNLTYCSPVSERLFGFSSEELLGKNMFRALGTEGEDTDEYQQVFENNVRTASCFYTIEHRCRHRDGRLVVIESSGAPVLGEDGRVDGFRGIDRDITRRIEVEEERRQLEVQYRQSQKLEALGTLAGGIAHDLNNMLTPILGYCELARLRIGADHPLQESLEAIDKSARRAAALIRQILAFSRKQVIESSSLNLNTLITDFAKMLQRLIREDVEMQFDLADDLWNIEADISQMEQVLLNLVVNAQDAFVEGGMVIVRTENKEVSYLFDIENRVFNGFYVVLSVIDNGAGIDKETLNMIFDPFFTTKEVGKGTGMGLATVHGIVRQHGGHVRVETAPGQGTGFYIYLPKVEQHGEHRDEIEQREEVAGGQETILLVEDDPSVLQMTEILLSEMGYTVLSAADGNEGLALFKERGADIDLLLTDLVMPGMGGRTLSAAIKEMRPEFPVIFMTGYDFNQEFDGQAVRQGMIVLQKPFCPKDLAGLLRKAFEKNISKKFFAPSG